ncbi:MAG TPA: hypothetical protein VJ954_01345, partial [Ignavibacteriaceae bacterium]|nr:hypothetical protein [Ignavibacteriaceae bacterium]
MKRYLLISLILATLFIPEITAQGTWKLVAPYPPRFTALSAAVIGNKIIFWCGTSNTYTTSDLGNSFTEYPPAPPSDVVSSNAFFDGMAFADSMNGTIVTGITEYRTTNGGSTWQQVSPANSYINIDIVCYDSSGEGWKFGGGGSYKTTDAGATWNFVSVPFGNSGLYACAEMLGKNKIWVLKSSYTGSYNAGAIWYSSNGGSTWSKINTGLVSDNLHRVTYLDFKMEPSGLGFATGLVYQNSPDSNFAFIQKTTDMGKTWSITKLPQFILRNLTKISDSTWITFGNSFDNNTGSIYRVRTTDAGATWTVTDSMLQYLAFNFVYSSIYSEKGKTLFVSTLGGMYTSGDNGLTFNRLTSNRDFFILNLGVEKNPPDPSKQMIIALSNTKSYLISTDAGSTWNEKEFPYSLISNFSQIRIAEGVIYFIPDQDNLYKSTDEGNTWNNIFAPSQGAIRAMDVLNKNTIFIEGYPWTLYSKDGGTTWTKSPLANEVWLNQSKIIDTNDIVSVGGYYGDGGTSGVIYHSTDSGKDWRIIQTPSEMKYVAFATNKLGVAVSDNYVYNTTDGGDTWNEVLRPGTYPTQYSAVTFENSYYGLLRVNNNFFETNDGGISWENSQFNSILTGALTNLEYGVNGKIYIVGTASFHMYSPSGNTVKVSDVKNYNSKGGIEKFQLSNYPNPF